MRLEPSPARLIYRLYAESASSLQKRKVDEARLIAEHTERQRRLERIASPEGDAVPPRVASGRLRIEIRTRRVKLSWIGVTFFDDLCHAYDGGRLAARVVKQDGILRRHVVAQQVSRLVVADAVPEGGLRRQPEQVFEGESFGLALKQPDGGHDWAPGEGVQVGNCGAIVTTTSPRRTLSCAL